MMLTKILHIGKKKEPKVSSTLVHANLNFSLSPKVVREELSIP